MPASVPQGLGCWSPNERLAKGCPGRVSPDSWEAEGTACPCPNPTQAAAHPYHGPVPTAAHRLACGINVQPRLAFIVQTEEDSWRIVGLVFFFLLLLFIGFFFFFPSLFLLPPPPLTEFLLQQAVETTTNVHQKNETRDASGLCACPGAHQQAQGAGRSQTSAIHGLSSTRQQASRQGWAENGQEGRRQLGVSREEQGVGSSCCELLSAAMAQRRLHRWLKGAGVHPMDLDAPVCIFLCSNALPWAQVQQDQPSGHLMTSWAAAQPGARVLRWGSSPPAPWGPTGIRAGLGWQMLAVLSIPLLTLMDP